MERFYTHAVERTGKLWDHNTTHYLSAATALGIAPPFDEQMVVGFSDTHTEDVESFLTEDTAYRSGRPTIVLHPGTSQATKCWPLAYFASVANALTDMNIVITGSPSEVDMAERIADKATRPISIAAGRLPHIGQTVSLLARSDGVVTGETSALHIASALGIPLVAVYGSTRPGENAPLSGRSELLFAHDLACAPCWNSRCRFSGDENLACLKQVTPDEVLSALSRLGIEKGIYDIH